MKERVRELAVEELPAMAKILKEWEQCSCIIRIDMDYVVKSAATQMRNGNGTVFGLFDRAGEIIGGLGCIKGPDLACGIMTAIETFWFVAPGRRGNGLKLLDAFEQWAEDNDCPRTAMIHLVDFQPEVLTRLYQDRGYKLIEQHFVRGISP